MRRKAASGFAALALAAIVSSASPPALPELFQKVKARVAAADWSGGLAALGELEAEAAKPENEAARLALRPAAAFYRGACLAALGKLEEARGAFAVYITAHPDKDIDRKAFPKQVVAAFEEARKPVVGLDGAKEVSALAAAYAKTPFPDSGSWPPPGPDWAEGPMKHLLSAENRRDFERLSDASARAEFVARFWFDRNPDPATAVNEFRREFERRVAFADERLSEGGTRGSLTDRGMVFILLGPPSAVIRRPISASEDSLSMLTINSAANPPSKASIGLSPTDQPSNWKEIWRYRREALPAGLPFLQVDFAFVTRIDYGKNVLQRDGPALRALDAARPRPRGTS